MREGVIKTAKISLCAGALLLLATAAFHMSGAAMVSGWLEGDRGAILRLLWYVPSIDWAVVATLWLFAGWRGDPRLRAVVWISALVPLAVALLLAGAVGLGFPGIWMLFGAVVLAAFGAARLGTPPYDEAA